MRRIKCASREYSQLPNSPEASTEKFLKSYWEEGAYYQFTRSQIEKDIVPAAREVERLYNRLLPEFLHDDDYMDALFIPENLRGFVRDSWQSKNASILGRMDFAYDGVNPPKLLEYNADTPAILYETGYCQGKWLDDMIGAGQIDAGSTQFNTLQDDLIAALRVLKPVINPLHLTCYEDAPEDRMTLAYMENCAKYAGIETQFVHYEQLTTDVAGNLYDGAGKEITALYRFYPWEMTLEEEEFISMLERNQTVFMEPVWKLLFSNKLVLARLWDKFEGHANLLPAYKEDDPEAYRILHDCVRKPVYSREGNNIEIISNDTVIDARGGPYEDSGFILQKRYYLPHYETKYPIVTVWIVDGKPSAMGILEQDGSPIIDNDSRFVPHVIIPG